MSFISVQNNHWQLSGSLVVDQVNAILDESMQLPMDAKPLTVDFSAVSIIDTAAIALMMAWQRRAKEAGCDIQFANVPDNLMSLANLYGVQNFIAVQPN